MWAGSLVVRIGGARDLLVVLQVDTDAGLQRVRTLLQPWVEQNSAPEVLTHDPAISLRLQPLEARSRSRGAGLQLVPQLRVGSSVMMRSREPDDVLRALAQVLGGAHECRRDDGRRWMGMRVFVREGSAVLVDLDRPAMVNDRLLAEAGVREVATWSTVITSDGMLAIPPPLPGLRWEATAVEPAPDGWQHYELAGIVVMNALEPTPAELLADVARRSIDGRWFTQVAAMAEAGKLANAADRPALRGLVGRLLEPAAME